MAELNEVREAVRERYATAARSPRGCGCSPADATGVFGSTSGYGTYTGSVHR